MKEYKVGTVLDIIRTDISYSRGINGIDFLTYKNAEVLEDNDEQLKVINLGGEHGAEDGLCYHVHFIEKKHITQIVEHVERKRYILREGAVGHYLDLTDEEYMLNIARGIRPEKM